MRTYAKLPPVSIFLFGLFFSIASAEDYAPVIDTNKVQKTYFRDIGSMKVPQKSEVPVESYHPASLFYISKISSTGDSQFQENNIVYLATGDSNTQVIDFYARKLPGWSRKTIKQKEIFLKTGTQFFWGGSKRLDGPRVEIIDLTANDDTIDIAIMSLKKTFPEFKTAIKIYYETSSTPLLDVDVQKLLASCIAKETEAKAKIYGGTLNNEARNFLSNMAKGSCEKVEKACKKNKEDRQCQRYARMY